jgi:hypothetical protein
VKCWFWRLPQVEKGRAGPTEGDLGLLVRPNEQVRDGRLKRQDEGRVTVGQETDVGLPPQLVAVGAAPRSPRALRVLSGQQ